MSLDGALGKIALRTRSAPRQLLQVSTSAGHTQLAGLISHTSTSTAVEGRKEPLSHRAVLIALEQIYDNVLDLEQLKRVQSNLLGAQRMAEEENGGDEEQRASAKAALEDW